MHSPELAKALRSTSERSPGPRSETRSDPEPSPQRDPSFSYHKTTNLGDQSWHLRDTNKPQPPPPVKLSFDSAPYAISCKGPSSPDPQGRRIPRACGHMRRPWKGDRNPTSPSLRTQNSKLEPNSKLQITKLQLKASDPKPNLATQNSNHSLVLSSFRSRLRQLKYSLSGTQEPSIWLQSNHRAWLFLLRKHPILKRPL